MHGETVKKKKNSLKPIFSSVRESRMPHLKKCISSLHFKEFSSSTPFPPPLTRPRSSHLIGALTSLNDLTPPTPRPIRTSKPFVPVRPDDVTDRVSRNVGEFKAVDAESLKSRFIRIQWILLTNLSLILFYISVSVNHKCILYKEPTRCNFGSIVY